MATKDNHPVVGKVYHGNELPPLEMGKKYHFIYGVDECLCLTIEVVSVDEPETTNGDNK